jgi:hypothetical protein
MMRATLLIFVGLMFSVSKGYAAEQTASDLAKMMNQAKYSEGFEARLNVLITKANGAHPAPFKLAVIGQFNAGKQRLVIRGISHEEVRNHFYAAESGSDGRVRAMESRSQASGYVDFDPSARMFNSGLVAWDMLGLWWGWQKQTLEGMEQVNGRECVKIRSVADDKNSVVQEVESCVDQQAKLSLRTRMFDHSHALLRTTSVANLAHKGEGGGMMAKKLSIKDADKTLAEIEVYAGDEQYQISAETFAMLDSPMRNIEREAK